MIFWEIAGEAIEGGSGGDEAETVRRTVTGEVGSTAASSSQTLFSASLTSSESYSVGETTEHRTNQSHAGAESVNELKTLFLKTQAYNFGSTSTASAGGNAEGTTVTRSVSEDVTRQIVAGTTSQSAYGVGVGTVSVTVGYTNVYEGHTTSVSSRRITGVNAGGSYDLTTTFSTVYTSTSEYSTSSTTSYTFGVLDGPMLGTSTTYERWISGSTTVTTEGEETVWTTSGGAAMTTTVSGTVITTESYDYTISGQTTTTLGRAGPMVAGTVVQAECGWHLFAAPSSPNETVKAAAAAYSLNGERLTLTLGHTLSEDTFSDSAMSAGLTSSTGVTTEATRTENRSRTTEHFTEQSIAGTVIGAVPDGGGYPYSNPYTLSLSISVPPEGEEGPSTVSVAGPAVMALTLVGMGGTDSTLTTLTAAAGVTATLTLAAGIAVAGHGCMAIANGDQTANLTPFNVFEIPCSDGAYPYP